MRRLGARFKRRLWISLCAVLRKRGFHQCAGQSHVQLRTVALFQLTHDAAHILDRFGARIGLHCLNRCLRRSFIQHLRQEFLDNGQFSLFLIGQFLAPAIFIHGDRFAALLGHFLQNLGHQIIVIVGCFARTRLDVAVLDLRSDQAKGSSAVLLASFH